VYEKRLEVSSVGDLRGIISREEWNSSSDD
jgi:hypothetical protein